jgi:hypothetical protein
MFSIVGVTGVPEDLSRVPKVESLEKMPSGKIEYSGENITSARRFGISPSRKKRPLSMAKGKCILDKPQQADQGDIANNHMRALVV